MNNSHSILCSTPAHTSSNINMHAKKFSEENGDHSNVSHRATPTYLSHFYVNWKFNSLNLEEGTGIISSWRPTLRVVVYFQICSHSNGKTMSWEIVN